jgi:hypothetical protein
LLIRAIGRSVRAGFGGSVEEYRDDRHVQLDGLFEFQPDPVARIVQPAPPVAGPRLQPLPADHGDQYRAAGQGSPDRFRVFASRPYRIAVPKDPISTEMSLQRMVNTSRRVRRVGHAVAHEYPSHQRPAVPTSAPNTTTILDMRAPPQEDRNWPI